MKVKRVTPHVDAGWRRVRSGRGFRYLGDDGGSAPASVVERATSLVIPPAWHDVWISRSPRGHIQAVGVDDAGRVQYLYHPEWTKRRSRRKFVRVLGLADQMAGLRRQVTHDLRAPESERDQALAVALRLLDTVAPRVGSVRHQRLHGTRGLTTLQCRDLTLKAGTVTLDFPAKGGIEAHLSTHDAALTTALTQLTDGVGPRSLAVAWHEGRRRRGLTAAEINAHLADLTGLPVTAKDFRVLKGTLTAARALARMGPVVTVADQDEAERLAVAEAAEALGNTVAVARKSYIHPAVLDRFRAGQTLPSPRSSERALLDLLAS